jgi:toxin ParE1/3/4
LPEAEASWAPAAERDVDDIWYYYAVNASPEIATRQVGKILAAVERVAKHPFHGRPRNEVRANLRSVRSSPYVVFYRVEPKAIEVMRVLHERRDFNAAFAENER